VGKRKRVDVYLEVRKRRGGIYFLNETSACVHNPTYYGWSRFEFKFQTPLFKGSHHTKY
jgi:hypothetical protein